jgi:hypothetical protein
VADLAVALLPFAPSRARLYAQHASSILGTKSDSILPTPMPPLSTRASSAPLAVRATSSASRATSETAGHYLAVPVSDISAPPVFNPRSRQPVAEPSKNQLVAAMAVAGLLGALCMVWFGAPRGEPTSSSVDPVVGAPAPAWTREPAVPLEAEPVTSRSVLIESQPSGALVDVGGQIVGITPLSTLLPVGTQQLSISKEGYRTEQAFVQLDVAPHGAKAVRTRVILHELPLVPASAAPAVMPPPLPAPKAARPALRRAPPRRAEAPREEPVAATDDAEPAPVAPARPEPTPVPRVETDTRPRLIDEPPRARLLD